MKNVFLALVIATLAACGDGGILDWDCDGEMSEAKSRFGEPNDVQSFTATGYNSVTYWWWWRGLAKTFTWGSNVQGACEVSNYTFTPIGNAIQ